MLCHARKERQATNHVVMNVRCNGGWLRQFIYANPQPDKRVTSKQYILLFDT